MRKAIESLLESTKTHCATFLCGLQKIARLQSEVESYLGNRGMKAFTKAFFSGYPLHILDEAASFKVNKISYIIENLYEFEFNLSSSFQATSCEDEYLKASISQYLVSDFDELINLQSRFLSLLPLNEEIVKEIILLPAEEVPNNQTYLGAIREVYCLIAKEFSNKYQVPSFNIEALNESDELSYMLDSIKNTVYAINLSKLAILLANMGHLGSDMNNIKQITSKMLSNLESCINKIDREMKILNSNHEEFDIALENIADNLKRQPVKEVMREYPGLKRDSSCLDRDIDDIASPSKYICISGSDEMLYELPLAN